jgi:hypothetical protein
VITDRKLTANRLNAKKSTGPKSVGGKRNSAQNSLRHGLAVRVRNIADLQRDIKAIAFGIARASGSDEITEASLQAAEAQVELFRIRNVRAAIHASGLSYDELNRRLASLERYERRAFSRRNRALRFLY